MKISNYIALILLTAAMVTAIACGGGAANNTNTARNTTNLGANNANVGAVVVNTNTNSMAANKWSNSNITREEYDKRRAEYEKDKGTSTIGSGVNDSWLWFKTRAALMTASDLRDSTINVDVENDVITLKGTVATAAEKASAEKVANGIEGKKKVVNMLKVAPNDSMTNMSGNSAANGNKK